MMLDLFTDLRISIQSEDPMFFESILLQKEHREHENNLWDFDVRALQLDSSNLVDVLTHELFAFKLSMRLGKT
jgi:hypothetical protein